MSGQTSDAVARTGNNPFLIAVAAISSLAGWVSAAMIVSAVLITCQMIWIRFVMNGSTIWQTEAVVYLMVAATLLGLPYVQRLRGHVNVDLIPMALPPRLRCGGWITPAAPLSGTCGTRSMVASRTATGSPGPGRLSGSGNLAR